MGEVSTDDWLEGEDAGLSVERGSVGLTLGIVEGANLASESIDGPGVHWKQVFLKLTPPNFRVTPLKLFFSESCFAMLKQFQRCPEIVFSPEIVTISGQIWHNFRDPVPEIVTFGHNFRVPEIVTIGC